jgi:hypothetical protein
MSAYLNRATRSIERLVRHFATRPETETMEATLVRSTTGGIDDTTLKPTTGNSITYNCRGLILNDFDFFSRLGVERVGMLSFGLLRQPSLWSPAVIEPIEQDRITCDGQVGVAVKIHTLAALWVVECDQ